MTVPLSGRREDDFEHIDAVARNGAGLLACEPPGTYILAHSRHLRGTTGICAFRPAGIDVERALIKPIAASRGFTLKLLKCLFFQPCAYRRFTSYIA